MLLNGPAVANHVLILAHGAGAPMDSPFMNYFAKSLAGPDLRVARFEFPYMKNQRLTGKRSGPNAKGILVSTWLAAIQTFRGKRIAIGGKSMGGRIASMVIDESPAEALVCLGYPFHPIGKPDQLRTAHLKHLATSTLIIQGTRDRFGDQTEVPGYGLTPSIKTHWMPDGDHSFTPRKSSGRSEQENWDEAISAIRQFLAETFLN